MSEEYGKPAIVPIDFHFESSCLAAAETSMTLSGKDVLGIVQSAFDDLGPMSERIIAVKRDVLDEVSEGKIAQALRTAIVGAGKAGCNCCA